MKTVRLVALSDTHTYHKAVRVPDGDVLVHAGDLTYDGRLDDVHSFLSWFSKQPHKHKVFVAGNHDITFENRAEVIRSMIETFTNGCPGLIYLQDQATVIEGLKFWGSPWTPEFMGWAFNVKRGKLWKKWGHIPEDTDVLVTHGPPAGDLGGVLPKFREEVGDPELAERIQAVRPKIHICGHVHEGYGRRERDGIIYVNASICDAAYDPIRQPIVIDLPGGNP